MGATKPRAPLDPNAFARGAIAASKRHLALSALLAAVVAALGAAIGAPVIQLVGIGVIAVGLVAYNLLRIRAATRALQSGPAGNDFLWSQRRLHLLRGTFYLIVSPLLVVFTGVALAREQPAPPLVAWLGFAACAALLAYGWAWWARALRRVRVWSAAQPPAQR